MTEIAFLVKPDSEMYRKYFKQKNELDKFVGFASSFIDKYFVSRNRDFDYSFSTNMRLTVKLPPNDEEWFGAQLMKERSESGLCVFKKNSPMNKRWHEECAMPSNTRTAIVGLLHDYCLKNQRSLDDLTEFEYLGPVEKADSPA